jgi:hypothetical protein
MNQHLIEIPERRRRCARHPDHGSGRLAHVQQLGCPGNITILPLPPKSPELNPVENIWQFIRETGSRTASSNPMMISSTTAATLGENCRTDHGRSCPSVGGNRPMSSDQRGLVLTAMRLIAHMYVMIVNAQKGASAAPSS